jgi:hypothetical protein
MIRKLKRNAFKNKSLVFDLKLNQSPKQYPNQRFVDPYQEIARFTELKKINLKKSEKEQTVLRKESKEISPKLNQINNSEDLMRENHERRFLVDRFDEKALGKEKNLDKINVPVEDKSDSQFKLEIADMKSKFDDMERKFECVWNKLSSNKEDGFGKKDNQKNFKFQNDLFSHKRSFLRSIDKSDKTNKEDQALISRAKRLNFSKAKDRQSFLDDSKSCFKLQQNLKKYAKKEGISFQHNSKPKMMGIQYDQMVSVFPFEKKEVPRIKVESFGKPTDLQNIKAKANTDLSKFFL